LAASPPYGWGVALAGKTAFSFVCKRKSGSELRKRKEDQWKELRVTVQPYKVPTPPRYPSGKTLRGIPLVSGGQRLSDSWFLLRHSPFKGKTL
jgi:hypothetical protein